MVSCLPPSQLHHRNLNQLCSFSLTSKASEFLGSCSVRGQIDLLLENICRVLHSKLLQVPWRFRAMIFLWPWDNIHVAFEVPKHSFTFLTHVVPFKLDRCLSLAGARTYALSKLGYISLYFIILSFKIKSWIAKVSSIVKLWRDWSHYNVWLMSYRFMITLKETSVPS